MRHASALELDSKGFIPELHGLRGMALSLVVLFHLFGNGKVSGGVDVFLVISGFLLTRSMFGRLTRHQPETFRRHYSRTASRLIPPALLVILISGLLSLALLPSSRWNSVGSEAVASLLYFENWELINSQLSYEAAGPQSSPFQHFWSLSVQGQFFFLWPLFLWLVIRAAQALKIDPWKFSVAMTAMVTAISFGAAVHQVTIDQQVAYFSSFTRWWELGFGSLIGLLLLKFSIPRGWKAGIAWGGIGMVLSGGFFLDAAATFPSFPALWPALGTAMVLAGSGPLHRSSPYFLLTHRTVTFFADIAYPLYLWHWPILVFYLTAFNKQQASFIDATVILLLSVASAFLTNRYVSDLSFRSLQARGFSYSLRASLAAILVPALLISTANNFHTQRQEALLHDLVGASPDHPGALSGPMGTDDWPTPFRPAADLAAEDRADIYRQGCVQQFRDGAEYEAALICEDPGTHQDSDAPLVVLTGGSHAGQWHPALRSIADSHGWELIVIEKGACRLVDPDIASGYRDSCLAWNRNAQTLIAELDPDLVVTVSTRTHKQGQIETMDEAQISVWEELHELDIPVVAIRDTPRFDWKIPDCVSHSDAPYTDCGISPDAVFMPDYEEVVESFPPNVYGVDMSEAICGPEECKPVIGNVLVHRDDNHLTASYVRTMTPLLESKLEQLVPHLLSR